MWDEFIVGFCKVEFLCYYGTPNWLGWIVLAVGAIVVCFIALIIYDSAT